MSTSAERHAARFHYGESPEAHRERLIYAVRRMAQNGAAENKSSGTWLSWEEIDAMLSVIPDVERVEIWQA